MPDRTGPRRKRYDVIGHARFLTFSCFGRMPLFQNDAIKGAFIDLLEDCRARDAFLLHAWVVMPEHVHVLLTPNLPGWTGERVANLLKSPFAKSVVARWREVDAPILRRVTDRSGRVRFWLRGGGYDRNVFTKDEFVEKLDYIHANPVRRGLVNSPTEWRWSSAGWYSDRRDCGVVPDVMEM